MARAPRSQPRGAEKKPASRPRGRLGYERVFWKQGLDAIAGVDEVGRGPLAGPVVAAAVILPEGCIIRGADDSKRLTAGARAELVEKIVRRALCVRIGAASPREIDEINILRASGLAMRRAVEKLRPAPQHLLVDGLPMPELGIDRQTAVVGGDGLVHSISCASIVAKVCRDRLMIRLAQRYPHYGWESNKGYATPEHREALRVHGPTPHHRRSFQPIEQMELGLLLDA